MKDKNISENQTIIGKSVKVEGDFIGEGNVVVEGQLHGTLKTTNHLTVGKSANIKADIEAGSAVVAGTITGNLLVTGSLEILASARIKGNISCQSLTIESGSQFNGQCSMSETSHSEKTKSDLSE